MLDLEPIRALLIESDAEAVELIPRDAELDEWWDSYSRLGHGAVLVRGPEGTVPPLAFFMANAPAYVAALLAEVERLRAELTGLRTYITRSIAADLAGVPEALEILDGLADEDMATVDQWIAAMSPRCQHDAELERLRADLLAQGEDNASLDRNLKHCVNTLRNVGEIIGVDLNDLSPDLLDRVRAAVQVRSTVADPCRLCGAPMALAEAGSGPGDEDLHRCSRAGCSGEYARDILEPRFIVRLEPGVWVSASDGDPGRTCVRASAKRFPTERSARRALSKARRFREFPKAVVECVK